MTAAFRQYWKDVTVPIVAMVVTQLGASLVIHDYHSNIAGISAGAGLVLALRLAVEPIKAAQRRRIKEILNSSYGKCGVKKG